VAAESAPGRLPGLARTPYTP